MHEVYKVLRAESGAQLYADMVITSEERPPASLFFAVQLGLQKVCCARVVLL